MSTSLTFTGVYISAQTIYNKLSANYDSTSDLYTVLNVPLSKDTFEQNISDADTQIQLYTVGLDLSDSNKMLWAQQAATYKACYEVLNAAVNNAAQTISNFGLDNLHVESTAVDMAVLTSNRDGYLKQYENALVNLQQGFSFPTANLAYQLPFRHDRLYSDLENEGYATAPITY